MKRFKVVYFILVLFLCSCLEQSQQRLGSGDSFTAGQEENSEPEVIDTSDEVNFTPIVEVTHLLDPIDGKYVKKLSLPKNYEGNLYIAGINLGTLKNKIVTVRFTFGHEKLVKEFRAVVGQSSQGVTSGIKVDLLTIDLSSQPFRSIHLPYDLYDYNDYSFDGVSGGLDEPVEDNRNSKLFCRGLKVEDDPSFNGVGTCSILGNECFYAFAKIKDNTLSEQIGSFYRDYIPSELSINQTGISGFYNQPASVVSKMCAPSNGLPFVLDNMTSIPINGTSAPYLYKGPFLENEEYNWQILGSARIGLKGIYLNSTGLEPLIFPRYVKSNYQVGKEYLGSDLVKGIKSIQNTPGKWMEGCHARVSSKDTYLPETMSSCTVSATIDVLVQDLDNPEQKIIASSKDVKLQLLAASSINKEGSDILSNSFSRCESSDSCGSDECCFNKRCWSKSIVSQCIDESLDTGNQPIGSSCSSDLQCASLCCNQTTAQCGVHDELSSPPVLCQKQAGQQCITKQFCQDYSYQSCKIVKSGPGQFDCYNKCENVKIKGDCINGSCSPASAPINPPWNPVDPNRCQNAENP